MNFCVVYKSKYGSSYKYGRMIADELKSPLLNLTTKSSILSFKKHYLNFDTYIILCGIKDGSPYNVNDIIRVLNSHNKKYILIYVGASQPSSELWEHYYMELYSDKDRLEFFYLPGLFDIERYTFKDALSLKKKLRRLESNKEKFTPASKLLVSAMQQGLVSDPVNRNNLNGFFKYIRSLN